LAPLTTNAKSGRSGPIVAELTDSLAQTSDPCEIEMIADLLGAAGNPYAIRRLLTRLGDRQVQEDADVDDAVCRALVALGVMSSSGNLSFAFRPRHLLEPDVAETI
jgi:hypothetical protein